MLRSTHQQSVGIAMLPTTPKQFDMQKLCCAGVHKHQHDAGSRTAVEKLAGMLPGVGATVLVSSMSGMASELAQLYLALSSTVLTGMVVRM